MSSRRRLAEIRLRVAVDELKNASLACHDDGAGPSILILRARLRIASQNHRAAHLAVIDAILDESTALGTTRLELPVGES